jgi:alpha-L-fucosidase
MDEPAEYRRTQSFELQYFDGKAWQVFCQGTTIGPELSGAFAPITTQRVRLNILKATDGPTIREFRLYAPSPESSTRAH